MSLHILHRIFKVMFIYLPVRKFFLPDVLAGFYIDPGQILLVTFDKFMSFSARLPVPVRY